MPATSQPFALLTVRRIAELTGKPVSVIEGTLDEHPDIQPTAVADFRPVYDRDAFLRLLEVINHQEEQDG